jgi:hypothetical protein
MKAVRIVSTMLVLITAALAGCQSGGSMSGDDTPSNSSGSMSSGGSMSSSGSGGY